MLRFFQDVRLSSKRTIKHVISWSVVMLIFGVFMGVLAKILDETPSNMQPFLFEALDLRNFLSRMGIWVFISLVITFFTRSPLRAAIYVFLFLAGMVVSYFSYTVFVAGFNPGTYMMIWGVFTLLSPFFAIFCWYGRGTGHLSIVISAILLTFFLNEAVSFGRWYVDILHTLEFLLFIGVLLLLYGSGRKAFMMVLLSFLLFLLVESVYWPAIPFV